MKVMKKAFLYRNKHLKYAITECNILKQASHPFVIKMHYSFQTPENLYMILEFVQGGEVYRLMCAGQLATEHARYYAASVVAFSSAAA